MICLELPLGERVLIDGSTANMVSVEVWQDSGDFCGLIPCVRTSALKCLIAPASTVPYPAHMTAWGTALEVPQGAMGAQVSPKVRLPEVCGEPVRPWAGCRVRVSPPVQRLRELLGQ